MQVEKLNSFWMFHHWKSWTFFCLFLRYPVFIWAHKFWGIWCIFSQTIQTILVKYIGPLSMFFIIQPLFLQKTKPLYSHPKHLFGMWIWIWATKYYGFSLCVSVVPVLGQPTNDLSNAIVHELLFHWVDEEYEKY